MNRIWLLKLREVKNLSHDEVAREARISRQYYGMIESGERNPSVEVAKKIGKEIGFDWTLFFEQEGNSLFLKNRQSDTLEVSNENSTA